tara:strand:- start:1343 stop:1954 length:612 start_codon:yes stop_codon:yes gene_type:complete
MFESLLLAGLLLGAVEGFKPGPLQTLVITETLKKDWRAGFKVTLAPLITDGPIILFCALVVSTLSNNNQLFAIISFAGAGFLSYMAYETYTISGVNISDANTDNSSLYKGIITNLLNPNPYIYWTLVGSPFLVKAFEVETWLPLVFIFSFFLVFIFCKTITAIIVERSKTFLSSQTYLLILKILALILVGFALIFVQTGLSYI